MHSTERWARTTKPSRRNSATANKSASPDQKQGRNSGPAFLRLRGQNGKKRPHLPGRRGRASVLYFRVLSGFSAPG